MAMDTDIKTLFGPVPLGIDLSASHVAMDNGVVIAMFATATFAVILRFLARAVLRTGLMADDWVIIVALEAKLRLVDMSGP
ncbi:hypothetical protein N7495_006888 [Penicillium taxi]|uniref:uncharacterized protein n=1 Tax=Penicillium taxi TaxID=168475 RepID=UPI002544E9B9|nr:uncharacterized protein N7495_006888 [Penicillium taxi]KAJ5895197.1 hypothetical protein N7495_006888 [Penicillium taxi]